MNKRSLSGRTFAIGRRGRRGVSLIIVLACLALLLILLGVFLDNIGNEVRSTRVYANGSSVKLLAQSAVNIVEAEIADAIADPTLCWASQPGMIRTYDNTGAAKSYYKLYSDDTMVGSGMFDHTDPTKITPSNWYVQKGVYIDLNEPIMENGAYHFPILDGNSSDLVDYPTTLATSAKGLGPLTNGQPQVLGFWLNSNTPVSPTSANQAPMPVKWLYVLQNGLVIAPDSGSGENGGSVTFNNSGGAPTAKNPIVARIAFWTDDESSKINVNTASESALPGTVKNSKGASSLTGSFVDTPRVCTAFDEAMAVYPAAQNEFQRYPGHPATVSLSSVFQNWTTDQNYPENIYPLTPRVNDGGSTEGAVQFAAQGNTSIAGLNLRSDRLYVTPDEFLFQPNSISGSRVTNASPNGSSPNLSSPGTGLAASTELDETAIEKSRFFLTASSRSPDLNPFNLPRVCMWPISSITGNNNRTPYDNLIAFCETIGNPPSPNPNNQDIYYFQRGDAITTGAGYGWESQTEYSDIPRNQTLLNYLRYFCGQPIPGFGSYVPSTATNGANNTLAAKYSTHSTAGTGTDMDQILMEIFDYIRCINLHDSSQGTNFHYFSNTPASPSAYTPYNAINFNDGVVVPSIDNGKGIKGFGRFPTISGAGMIFLAAAIGPTTLGGADQLSQPFAVQTPAGATEPSLAQNATRVQAALVFSLFDPSQGFYGEYPDIVLQVIPKLSWDATGTMNPMHFGTVTEATPGVKADGSTAICLMASGSNSTTQPPWGGELGIRYLTGGYGAGYSGSQMDYPLSTGLPFTMKSATNPSGTTYGDVPDYAQGKSINMSGSVTVNVFQGVSNVGNPGFRIFTSTSPPNNIIANHSGQGANGIANCIQSITFTFPSIPIPLPTKVPGASATGTVTYNSYPIPYYINSFNDVYSTTTGNAQDSPGRFLMTFGGNYYYPYPILPGDSVQSLISASGDLRLTSAQAVINTFASGSPGSSAFQFTHHPIYGTQMAHSFVESNGLVLSGATRGQLIPNVAQYWVGGGTTTPGSFYTYSPFSDNVDPTKNEYNAAFSCEPEGFALSSLGAVGASGVIAGAYGATTGAPGDWDNGTGALRDGPYINKADEGEIGNGLPSSGSAFFPAYFSNAYTVPGGNHAFGNAGAAYFSPARQIPSAGMLGSLPTGVFANRPWQTLLFHPDYTGSHLGGQSPPDYLLLDFFHMPVVEPYAISEPLSTAGRINMNYLIVPFTYINRDTGIRAVLQSQQMLAIPNINAFGTSLSGPNGYQNNSTTVAGAYKQICSQNNYNTNFFSTAASTYRFSINLDQTLQGFLARFNAKDIFRSTAEICGLDLVPNDTGAAYGSMQAYWKSHALTGDNSREKPYANIYPLLTTKSNTFTVHYRVQVLKKLTMPGSDPTKWQEGTDVIAGEYRGSQTIERYIDPSDSRLTEDYASDVANGSTVGTPLPTLYKFRVVSSNQFAP